MTTRARWMVLAAACLMATAYVFPLWRVDLIAPQYPEGLGMFIHVNGVEGLKPNDLHSINNLNHYIGMKAIEPDAIPELRFMPWILAALIAGGLAVAATGKRTPLNVWGVALGLVLVAGLADFYRWGYDYGHDLDQDIAIIKIPGMTYQPPLIGSKKLLNFRATSWPSTGGIALTLAAGLVAAAMFDSRRRKGAGNAATVTSERGRPVTAALLLALGTASCAAGGPRDLIAGEDQCGFCRMEISDPRFGAQVILATGQIHVFDSVECAASFAAALDPERIRSVWVSDADLGTFVAAERAGYVAGGTLRSPMGQVVAFASPADAATQQARLGGSTVSWGAVLADSAGLRSHGGH